MSLHLDLLMFSLDYLGKKTTSKAPFPRQNYQLELKIYDKHTPTYLCMSIILLGFNEVKIIYKYDIAFIYLIF